MRRLWRWLFPVRQLDGTWRDWFPTGREVLIKWAIMVLLAIILTTISHLTGWNL